MSVIIYTCTSKMLRKWGDRVDLKVFQVARNYGAFLLVTSNSADRRNTLANETACRMSITLKIEN